MTYFLDLLKNENDKFVLDKFKSALICNYLIRGFSNVISELKLDFVTKMKEFGLSKSLLTQVISLAGQDLGSMRKSQIVSQPILELQTD